MRARLCRLKERRTERTTSEGSRRLRRLEQILGPATAGWTLQGSLEVWRLGSTKTWAHHRSARLIS